MTTEITVPPDIDVDGGLLGRRSVLGGLLVLAVITFFSTGLNAIDELAKRSDGFAVGETIPVTPGVEFTPAEGWVNDPDQTVAGEVVVAQKNGWEIKISAGLQIEEGGTLEDLAEVFRFTDDAATQITDTVTFTTDAGDAGVTWETHGPTNASATWLVDGGDAVVLMLASGSAQNFDSVEAELVQMAASISFGGSDQ